VAYVGFRIWYADGSVRTSNEGTWAYLPSDYVQFVTWYEERTYRIWLDDHWATENYCLQLHGQDYYWLDSAGVPGAGPASAVPAGLPVGATKVGTWMLDGGGTAYWELAAQAQQARVAP
jgi:hypothetical protein